MTPPAAGFLAGARVHLLLLPLPLLLLLVVPQEAIIDHGSWHSLLEVATIATASLIFSIAWSAYPVSRSPAVLLAACGFLAVALLDTAHLLSFPGTADWITVNHANKEITLGFCARLIATLTLFGITHARWANTGAPVPHARLLLFTGIGSGLLIALIIAITDTPGSTFFAPGMSALKAGGGLIVTLCCLTLLRLRQQSTSEAPYDRQRLVAALSASVVAEALLMQTTAIGDTNNLLGHLYTAIAYYQLYIALFHGLVREPFLRLAQTEAALRASEGKLANLFEASPDGTLVLAPSGRIVRANAQCARLFGYGVRELCDLPLPTILPDLDPAMIVGHGGGEGRRFTARRRSGAEFAVEIAFSPVELAGSHHVIATVRDISIRDQLERRLEANEARLRSFLDNSVDWVWEIDASGVITYASSSVQQLLGYGSAEVVGRPYLSLLDDEERARIGPYWRECMGRQEALLQVEKVMRHRDGRHVYLESSASPFCDAQGRCLGYRGIDRDISRRNAIRNALAESEQRFRQAFDHAPIGIAITEADGRHIDTNHSLADMLGIKREELLTRNPRSLAHPGDYEASLPLREAVVNGLLPSAAFDIRYRKSDGKYLWARTTLSLIRSPAGPRHYLLVQIQNTTAARLGQQSSERLLAIVENTEVAISLIDRQLHFSYLNPAARRLMGIAGNAALGDLDLAGFYPQETAAVIVERALPQAERSGTWAGETLWRTRDDTDIPMWEIFMAHRDDNGEVEYWSSIARDLRESRQCEARLTFQDTHDALTALPNRTLLRDRFQQALTLARRKQSLVALILIDLDHFKRINDYLGHGTGDSVLLEVSHRLRQCLRETDTLARQGGDEFTILLSDVATVQDIVTIADKLISNLQDAIIVGQREVFATASCGISVYPYDQDHIDELLRKAEVAMYQAKENGRNTYLFYTSEMDQRYRADLEIEGELRHAIERNELELHYQPKFRLSDHHLVGFEALLRWRHPTHGLVPPGRFIPIAERSNLIVALGEWALLTACRQTVVWQRQGYEPGSMAVNVSAQQFEYSDVAEAVGIALADSGLAPARLELEITEGVLMSDPTAAGRILENLKAKGISIAIDDFGTGYSSLGYLKRFPVDVLKIDRSFVAEVNSNSDDAAIVCAIVSMAHALDISLVAEGIETEAQSAFLRQSGCDTAQGFLFSRPLDTAQANALLALKANWGEQA
jgi:diguanylate cyclase (GGDEF)-like protein/PAS domain S-box-containing protein